MGAGYNGGGKPSTETLAMSYDPQESPSFVDEQHRQQKLAAPDGGFVSVAENRGDPRE